ncbi:hypothetical protein VP01_67g1 [Puccinia sorghi]|uniref:Uncharacterized protein n=1 Tax=Puccinia sorghi TaxID=27349 RepID=A0A0L6UGP6_9BASI|nr:hypothetical protein VP01_67g1 [Puccinia sorghi]
MNSPASYNLKPEISTSQFHLLPTSQKLKIPHFYSSKSPLQHPSTFWFLWRNIFYLIFIIYHSSLLIPISLDNTPKHPFNSVDDDGRYFSGNNVNQSCIDALFKILDLNDFGSTQEESGTSNKSDRVIISALEVLQKILGNYFRNELFQSPQQNNKMIGAVDFYAVKCKVCTYFKPCEKRRQEIHYEVIKVLNDNSSQFILFKEKHTCFKTSSGSLRGPLEYKMWHFLALKLSEYSPTILQATHHPFVFHLLRILVGSLKLPHLSLPLLLKILRDSKPVQNASILNKREKNYRECFHGTCMKVTHTCRSQALQPLRLSQPLQP